MFSNVICNKCYSEGSKMIEYVLVFDNTYKTEAINVVSWAILVQRKARQLFLLPKKHIMFPDFCGSTLSVSLKWYLFTFWFCIKNNIANVIEYGDRQCLSCQICFRAYILSLPCYTHFALNLLLMTRYCTSSLSLVDKRIWPTGTSTQEGRVKGIKFSIWNFQVIFYVSLYLEN